MSTPNPNDEKFMRRAIEMSRRGSLEYSTGGVFGAVLVKDGKIVSEGMNRVVASHDPTWHAEMETIRLACITLQSFKLPGCTLYTSAEACPMCMATCTGRESSRSSTALRSRMRSIRQLRRAPYLRATGPSQGATLHQINSDGQPVPGPGKAIGIGLMIRIKHTDEIARNFPGRRVHILRF